MEKSPNCALAILYYYSTKARQMAGLRADQMQNLFDNKKGDTSNDALLQHL